MINSCHISFLRMFLLLKYATITTSQAQAHPAPANQNQFNIPAVIKLIIPQTTAIARHSDFKLEGITDPRTLLHARLIRDADKLDNCRVKLEDDLLVFMGASEEEIGAQAITPVIYDTVFKNQCVYSPDRVTRMDYWVSYVAYFLDINYRATLDIIEEHDYLNKIIDRIPYSNSDTRQKMEDIRTHLAEFIHTSPGYTWN